jgi:hypothetical protein
MNRPEGGFAVTIEIPFEKREPSLHLSVTPRQPGRVNGTPL